mmetsp:Transcript_87277/g.130947  ORF Transcript_87277/g.130947 Transcript_87277/m.130947 type:complete len:265 (-) Transcript_87277:274-1068(-)
MNKGVQRLALQILESWRRIAGLFIGVHQRVRHTGDQTSGIVNLPPQSIIFVVLAQSIDERVVDAAQNGEEMFDEFPVLVSKASIRRHHNVCRTTPIGQDTGAQERVGRWQVGVAAPFSLEDKIPGRTPAGGGVNLTVVPRIDDLRGCQVSDLHQSVQLKKIQQEKHLIMHRRSKGDAYRSIDQIKGSLHGCVTEFFPSHIDSLRVSHIMGDVNYSQIDATCHGLGQWRRSQVCQVQLSAVQPRGGEVARRLRITGDLVDFVTQR